ncbi:transposase [Pendulispora brunnea]|uniref:IS66 family transposase n=1 Tax=Pendulispora brunnea TaxID=2905690 RepID=UPI00374E1B87
MKYAVVKDQRGLLRTALGYALRHREALGRFLDDGRLRMENNASERALRTGSEKNGARAGRTGS